MHKMQDIYHDFIADDSSVCPMSILSKDVGCLLNSYSIADKMYLHPKHQLVH